MIELGGKLSKGISAAKIYALMLAIELLNLQSVTQLNCNRGSGNHM